MTENPSLPAGKAEDPKVAFLAFANQNRGPTSGGTGALVGRKEDEKNREESAAPRPALAAKADDPSREGGKPADRTGGTLPLGTEAAATDESSRKDDKTGNQKGGHQPIRAENLASTDGKNAPEPKLSDSSQAIPNDKIKFIPAEDRPIAEFEYDRVDLGSLGLLDNVGNGARAAIEVIALDIIDRDRRIVPVLQRQGTEAAAYHVATALCRTVFKRSGGENILDLDQFDAIKDAMGAALDGVNLDEKDRAVFIETLNAIESSPGLREFLDRKNEPMRHAFSDWLRERGAVLIVMIKPGFGARKQKQIVNIPQSYWIPWTEFWLDQFSQAPLSNRFEFHELRDTVGQELLDAETEKDECEARLFTELSDLSQSITSQAASAPRSDDQLIKAIKEAIKTSATGAANDDAARQFLEEILQDPAQSYSPRAQRPDRSSGETFGEIGRTVILVWACLRSSSPLERSVRALAYELLPDGEAPISMLPEVLRQRWDRQRDDDKRLAVAQRDPPTWRDVFQHVQTRVFAAIGLDIDGTGRLVAGRKLTGLDFDLVPRSQPVLIGEFVKRIRSRQLFRLIAPDLRKPLVDFLMEIYRSKSDLIGIADIVSLFTGLEPPSSEFMVPAFRVKSELQPPFSTLSELVVHVGDVTKYTAQFAADLDDPQYLLDAAKYQDESLCGVAAASIKELLNFTARSPAGDADFMKQFVTIAAERTSFANIWMLLAYLVLDGPSVETQIVGLRLLRPLAGQAPDDFEQRFNLLRDLFKSVSLAAVDLKDLSRFERWIDALWSVATDRQFSDIGVPIASYFDDYLSNLDIPWGHRRPLDKPSEPPVLARLCFGASTSSDLLARLFKRTANDHFGAIKTVAERRSEMSVYGEVTARFLDVYWVLTDEVDLDELSLRGISNEAMEEAVWNAIAFEYGLASIASAHEATASVMEADEWLPGDPRRRSIELLDLYSVAVLAYWRFRTFGPAALQQGSQEAIDFRACLARLQSVAAPRLKSVHLALRALAKAEERLEFLFNTQGADRTAKRHLMRRDRIKAMVGLFAPAALPVG